MAVYFYSYLFIFRLEFLLCFSSRDVLIVPPDDDDEEPKTESNNLATVSIKICPPTPTPPGTAEHKSAVNENTSEVTEQATVETVSESERDIKPAENEAVVSMETRVVEQSSSSHT